MTSAIQVTPPSILHSSKRDDWETPGSTSRPNTFFFNLQQEFQFDLDAAAHEMNAKLPTFLTEDDDALTCEWPGISSFVNPPYGRGVKVGKWLDKISIEFNRRRREHVVALIAARTDTLWFHDIIWQLADEVRFVRGRLVFEIDGKPVLNPKTGDIQPATFPSMLAVFRRKPKMRSEERPLFRSISPLGLVLDEEVPL